MGLTAFFEKVLIVIVVYEQSVEQTRAFASIQPLIDVHPDSTHILIYDNSSQQAAWRAPYNSTYIRNDLNPGVSAAYNSALATAKDRGLKFLLLLDQDTFVPLNTFKAYSMAVADNPEGLTFAPIALCNGRCYSPFKFINGKGQQLSNLQAGTYSFRNYKIINSGLLVSTLAFEKCGGYDERFGLDLSDVVFCDRLAAQNFSFNLIPAHIDHHHSSLDKNCERNKVRFDRLLHAMSLYSNLHEEQKYIYWIGAFPRALKLTARYLDWWFMKRFFQHMQ